MITVDQRRESTRAAMVLITAAYGDVPVDGLLADVAEPRIVLASVLGLVSGLLHGLDDDGFSRLWLENTGRNIEAWATSDDQGAA